METMYILGTTNNYILDKSWESTDKEDLLDLIASINKITINNKVVYDNSIGRRG